MTAGDISSNSNFVLFSSASRASRASIMRAVRPGSDLVSSSLLSTSLIYGRRFFVLDFATFTESFFALADFFLAGVLPFFFVVLLFDAEATDAAG